MTRRRSGRRAVLLVLLGVPLLSGLVGMHTLVDPVGTAATSSAAVHQEHPAAGHCERSTPHEQHLCPAVVSAVGPTVALAGPYLGLLVFPAALSATGHRSGGAPAARPPPVPRRLARLCVMRN